MEVVVDVLQDDGPTEPASVEAKPEQPIHEVEIAPYDLVDDGDDGPPSVGDEHDHGTWPVDAGAHWCTMAGWTFQWADGRCPVSCSPLRSEPVILIRSLRSLITLQTHRAGRK